MTHYDTLDLSKTASGDEIKAQFRALSLQHHPDRGGSNERFKQINEAYSVLRDEGRRLLYDELLQDGRTTDFEHSTRPTRSPDSLIELDVSLEELFCGCKKTLRVERAVRCGICTGEPMSQVDRALLRTSAGSGAKLGAKRSKCSSCAGEGLRYIQERLLAGNVLQSRLMDCPNCRGSGCRLAIADRCQSCRGKGTVQETVNIDVIVKAGQDATQMVELPGEGDASASLPGQRTTPGNLIIKLCPTTHPTFVLTGRDLQSRITLTLSEALLGPERIVLVHLDGSGVRWSSSSQPWQSVHCGEMLKISGLGMPACGDSQNGDLYLRVAVEPSLDQWLQSLNPRQRATLESLLPGKRPEMPEAPQDVHDVAIETTKKFADFATLPESETPTSSTCVVM